MLVHMLFCGSGLVEVFYRVNRLLIEIEKCKNERILSSLFYLHLPSGFNCGNLLPKLTLAGRNV